MKLLVIGHRGLLGSEIIKAYEHRYQVVGRDIDELDITSFRACQQEIGLLKPDLIINCAAYTDVDGAESDPAQAHEVNERGPENLARIAAGMKVLLVHFSTDYVFDGRKKSPYNEQDTPGPLSVYGMSKLAGEQRIVEQTDNALIIRTSWLYGGQGKSFPRTIIRLALENKQLRVVDDQRGCPTYAPDLANHIEALFQSRHRGLVHVTNSGHTTWFEFARSILSENKMDQVQLIPVSTEMFPRPAPRPSYSVLDTTLFQTITGTRMRPWQEAIHHFISTEF